MKIQTNPQIIKNWVTWIGIGFGCVGSVVGTINDVLDWVTPTISLILTVLAIIIFGFITYYQHKNTIHRKNKKGVVVGKYIINIKSLCIIIGIIIALWIPVLFPNLNPDNSPQTPSITAYRVVNQDDHKATLEVDYVYDQIYGDQVYIGACLYQDGTALGDPESHSNFCGYYYPNDQDPSGQVPTVGKGTARIIIQPFVDITEKSDEIEIFLNRWGKGNTVIVSRRFPYIRNWEPE